MAEPSPKEEPPPKNVLCKLVAKVPFQMPTCPSVVDTVLREKLGILSPKEIYIPGPEHDNCTLQSDKYYTQGKQKSKEKDRKKPENDGHGAHAHCVRGECASHSHMTSQGHTHIHEEGHSYGENLENPVCSPLGSSDEHDCLRNSHANCCKSCPPSPSLLKKSLQVIKIIPVFLIRTAYAYRLQLLMILRQGVLPTIRMWIPVCRMMTAVQRVVFRKNRLRMIAMERVPQLTLSRNAQKITTAMRQDPTHMASTTKIHGRVLKVIAPPSTLL